MTHGRVLVLALFVAACAQVRQPPAPPPTPTIADRVAEYGPSARARLLPFFSAAGVPYPPERILLLALKQERELQLYAAGPGQALAFIRTLSRRGAACLVSRHARESSQLADVRSHPRCVCESVARQ